jgi:hypothetical protein
VVKLVDLGLPELTNEQIETVCTTAENAARKFIFSQINPKQLQTLNISVEAEGTKPINFTVEIDLELSSEAPSLDEKKLADEAVKAAFEAIESFLRTIT